MRYPIAGVGYAKGFDTQGNIILNSVSLTDSGFNASTSLEEIRGGEGNGLFAMYSHTSQFAVTLKDCMVDLQYVALQVGGNITAGADVFKTEEITVSVANKITVSEQPKTFGGYGIVGWYNVAGSDVITTVTFDETSKTASVSDLKVGTVVCVTYVITDDSARAFDVASTFLPSTIHLVMTLPLLNSADTSNASQVGEWIVDIPRFMFNGSIDLSTTSAGKATGDISGKALASGKTGCSGKPKYATIKEYIYKKDTFANVSSIAIVDSDVDLKVGETQTLKIMGIYNDGTMPTVLDNKYFTFTSSGASATVSTSGLVTASSAGSANIEVVVTGKTSLSAQAVVTVTA